MMKKFLILALTFMFAIMLTLPIFAEESIGKGTPKLDGEKDDIYTVSLSYPNSPLYHDNDYGDFHPADVPSEIVQSMEAMTYLLWDDNHIYFLVEVVDDEFTGLNDESVAYWAQGDGVILMYYPKATDDNTLYSKLRIAYSAATFNATPAATYSEYPDQVEYKFLQTDVGYNLEVFITLGEDTLKEGDVIHFATQVCDISDSYSRGYAYVNDSYTQITSPWTLGSEAVVIVEEIAAEVPAESVSEATSPAAPTTVSAPQTSDSIIFMVILLILSAVIPVVIRKKIK